MRDFSILTLLAVAYLSGCRPSPPPTVNEWSATWLSDTPENIPGVDRAAVTFIRIASEPSASVPIVVWSDLPKVTTRSSTNADSARFEGSHSAADGRRIDIRCIATGANAPQISVAGRDVDPTKGVLLLVSTAQNITRFEQLNLDLAQLPFDETRSAADLQVTDTRRWVESLKQLARTDKRIADFFAATTSQTADATVQANANPPSEINR